MAKPLIRPADSAKLAEPDPPLVAFMLISPICPFCGCIPGTRPVGNPIGMWHDVACPNESCKIVYRARWEVPLAPEKAK